MPEKIDISKRCDLCNLFKGHPGAHRPDAHLQPFQWSYLRRKDA